MRILILGATGFAGTALCRALKERGHSVFAADITGTELYFNLSDKKSAGEVIKKSLPDTIVLLSGASSVGASWKNPAETFSFNVSGALNAFESFLEFSPRARFIFAGSAEEYGRTSTVPFKEDNICTPANPYALSKHTAAQTMHMLADRNHAEFIHLRLANHFGPGQRKGFVVADFASQIADKMKNHDQSDIKVGNLDVRRDFLYIDDAVDAYVKIIEAESLKHNTYNIGTGSPVSIRILLDTLLKISGAENKISVDPEKVRKADIPETSLDPARIAEELNWKAVVPIETALQKTFASWLSR